MSELFQKIISFIFIVFYLNVISSQSLDSLRWILKLSEKQSDVVLGKANYKLGVHKFKTGELDSSEFYLKNSIKFFEKIQQDTLAMLSFQVLGIVNHYKQNYDKAINYLKIANKVAREYNDTTFITNTYLLVSSIYTEGKQNYIEAYKYLDSGELYLSESQKTEFAFSKIAKGNLLFKLFLFDEALISFQEGLELVKKDSADISSYLLNISSVYKNTHDYVTAKEYLLNALMGIEGHEMGDSIRRGKIYYSLAQLFCETNEYDSAFFYCKKAKNIFKEIEDVPSYFSSQVTLSGDILYYTNKDEAIIEFLSIDTTGKRLQDKVQYYTLGLRLEIIIPNERIIERYISLTLSNKYYKTTRALAFETYSFYTSKNNPRLALKYHEYYTQANDSILSIDKIIKVQSIKLKQILNEKNQLIEQEKYEREKAHSELKIQKHKKRVWFLIVVLLGVGVVFLIFIYQKNLKAKNQELENEILNKKLIEKDLYKFKDLIKNKNKQILQLEKLQKEIGEDYNLVAENLISKINNNQEWAEFMIEFEAFYPNFFKNIKKSTLTNLTQYDIRLASLLKLNLSNQEISEILFIAHSSVKKAKNRLTKKLKIPENITLGEFILGL